MRFYNQLKTVTWLPTPKDTAWIEERGIVKPEDNTIKIEKPLILSDLISNDKFDGVFEDVTYPLG